jgi:hypothetical protein
MPRSDDQLSMDISAERLGKLEAIRERAQTFERTMASLPAEQIGPTLIEGSHMWGDILLESQDPAASEKLCKQIIELAKDTDFGTLTATFCGLIAISLEPVFPGQFGRMVAVGGVSKIIGRMIEKIAAVHAAQAEAETATKQ